MDELEKHVNLLGYEAEDKVTGFKGVVTTVGFDLYGCVQAALTPKVTADGKQPDGRWFDMTRLNVGNYKVMEAPDFSKGYIAEGKKGAAEKPLM